MGERGNDVGDRLLKGEKLERGQALTSRNGAYTLTLQDDGNLVLAARGQAVWATGTNGQDVVRADVQTDEPPPPPPAPRTYTVVSGDTLWAISERFYGDGSKYQRIADASGISNPDLIHPGQVLTIP